MSREALATARRRLDGALVVDISDIKVSSDPSATIITHGLGSCIAVILHDPTRRAAGMIHYMLPRSKISPDKAKVRPAMFADTGVPLLFERMYEMGCRKPNLIVKVVGGASLHDVSGRFDIGRRNYTILRKLLWKNGVPIAADDVGGDQSRTVRVEVGSGRVMVRSNGTEREL